MYGFAQQASVKQEHFLIIYSFKLILIDQLKPIKCVKAIPSFHGFAESKFEEVGNWLHLKRTKVFFFAFHKLFDIKLNSSLAQHAIEVPKTKLEIVADLSRPINSRCNCLKFYVYIETTTLNINTFMYANACLQWQYLLLFKKGLGAFKSERMKVWISFLFPFALDILLKKDFLISNKNIWRSIIEISNMNIINSVLHSFN